MVVAKKRRKPAAKKVSMPPHQGESEDPPTPKAKRAPRRATEVAAPKAKAPPKSAPKKSKGANATSDGNGDT